jgi:hypothetical protein
MTTVEEIEKAILRLPKNEVAELSAWFEELETQSWDDQIVDDATSGRFDSHYAQAIAEFEAGETKPL